MSFRPRGPAAWFAAACLAAFASPANASAPVGLGSRPIVPAFERLGSSLPLAQGGGLLIGELNCVACHRAEAGMTGPVAPKQPPILTRVGERTNVAYLRTFLSGPAAADRGTTMPDLIAGLPEAERAATVEALVHLLASTGTVKESFPALRSINRGRALFGKVGCVACHGDVESKDAPLADSVPLGNLAGKYTLPGLSEFLADPHKVRPSGRMPSLNLKKDEALDVAGYLLRDTIRRLPTNTAFTAYEGSWSSLPDLSQLTPTTAGFARGFDLGASGATNNYALRFEASLPIPADGEYRFQLSSDDGSRLELDGKLVVDHDGVHPSSEKSGRATLKAGAHQLVVTYFDSGGQTSLDLEMEGEGLPWQPVETLLTPAGPAIEPTAPAPEPFRPDPSLVEKGRTAFTTLGCASCHELRVGDTLLTSMSQGPGLASLEATKGCLAEAPGGKAPRYGLDRTQREAIAAAVLEFKAPAVPLPPARAIARTMAAFNCYACHKRDDIGGVEEARDLAFQTTQKEMGEEGRLPPPLDGVGAKLTDAWLRTLLDEGSKDRPYMETRMPRFGGKNVGHLAALTQAVDHLDPAPPAEFNESDRKVKAAGRMLAGSRAFGCVACHTFNGSKASGIQSIDMTLMTARLRHDWFRRYVVDPQSFRPGTRMPSVFYQGKSMLPAVLDGSPAQQVESIWKFLSDGRSAAPPAGVGREPIPLVPNADAIIYRNFIEGAGPRAIGVGYPERANLAFDANDLRLALVWQGDFIDASRHWIGRGEGYQPPLGDNVLSLPAGPAFASLVSPTTAWPAESPRKPGSGSHFRGYRLGNGRKPTFLYDVGGVQIEDRPVPVPGVGKQPAGFRRELTLTPPKALEGLYFRVAVADSIVQGPGGWFTIGGDWKTRLTGDAAGPGIVRESGGRKELLVPIRLEGPRATLIQEISW
ncbi:c-type cytochrome [Isosphaeraceae bacterium EP7]